MATITGTINITTTGVILLARSNRHDPQPVYQNNEQILSRSKQYRVSISTIGIFLQFRLELGL